MKLDSVPSARPGASAPTPQKNKTHIKEVLRPEGLSRTVSEEPEIADIIQDLQCLQVGKVL